MKPYKGYRPVIEFDQEAGLLFGTVASLRDVVTFEGTSVQQVEQAFHASVDDYLAMCAERGEGPDLPYSGKFVVRMEPSLHRTLVQEAEASNQSLNAYIAQRLAASSPATTPTPEQGK